ncbi:MAG: hypothetical protein DHS20C17_11050 [Cyclobacteriaceae bacterium]|nr:MAG: hypothetical protein DHS20C17_11050 [Cyclobacteriaceae bacterium]
MDEMINEQGVKNDLRKVLLVSIAAPPYTNPESLQFSKYLKYLVGGDLQLSMVTAKISDKSPGWRKVDNEYLPVMDQLEQIIKVPAYFNSRLSGALKRLYPGWFNTPDNERRFISGWKTVVRELEVRPDLIYSRSSPVSSTIMALKLHQYYQVPWVMHLSDPWTLSPFFELGGNAREYHLEMEMRCISSATKICFTSEEQIGLYRHHYPQFSNKFEWFPNVYDDSQIISPEPDFESRFTFVHTGNFYGKQRKPDSILEAISAAHKEQPALLADARFLFAGFQDNSITKRMSGYEQFGVEYIGPLTFQECNNLYKEASVLAVIDFNLPAEQAVFFLSKTLDYLSAGKPILTITPPGSTLYKVIHGRYGSCFAHDDIPGIKNYIIEMTRRYKAKDAVFSSPYQLEQKYSARVNSSRLSNLIHDLIDNN